MGQQTITGIEANRAFRRIQEILEYYEKGLVVNRENKETRVKKESKSCSLMRMITRTMAASFNTIKPLYLTWRDRRYLKRLKQAEGKETGRICLILGNGPSQEFIDFSALETEVYSDIDILCINSFAVNADIPLKRIKHFVISDPAHIMTLLHPDKEFANSYDKQRIAKAMDLAIRSGSRIYMPMKHAIEDTHRIDSSIYFFNDYEFMPQFHRFTKPVNPRGYSSMTLLKGISIARYLGYSEILICGSDNDYASNYRIGPDNKTMDISQHAVASSYVYHPNNPYDSHTGYLRALLKYSMSIDSFSCVGAMNMDPFSYTQGFKKISPDSEYFELLKPEARYMIKAIYEFQAW